MGILPQYTYISFYEKVVCKTVVLSCLKSDEKKIEAFELWCYRRLLRISWTDRESNEWVLERRDCKGRLQGTITRR